MQSPWLQTAIWKNRARLGYLIALVPASVFIVVFIYNFFLYGAPSMDIGISFGKTIEVFFWLGPILIVWLIVGIFLQRQIIFAFTGAREITRKSHPEIYNIVENLCIEKLLPVPKIGIMDDNSMNAFATGWSTKNSWIVFSQWILDRLNRQEIEAVAGHELTHIINGDVKNMVIVNVFIGAVSTIGYYMFRVMASGRSNSNSKGGNPLALLGLALYLLGLLLLPLVNLAISRKKEYLADAGSVVLTHDNQAMISALQKISTDSRIEKIDTKSSAIASMFIHTPKKMPFMHLFATHPPIEERIKALKTY